MATIHYGLAGEGRGHAARASAIIDHLAPQHRVVVHSFGQALELLAPRYRGTTVQLREIPGLFLGYRDGRVSRRQTLYNSIPFVTRLRQASATLAQELRHDDARLVVSDFEPVTARAAESIGIPWVSIDHQRLLWVCRLEELSLRLRLQARLFGLASRLLYRSPPHQAVSGFFLPELRRGHDALRVGVLLREELLNAIPSDGEHLVAYLRRGTPANVLDALATQERSVRVYGLGCAPPRGSLHFYATDTHGFVLDLASARGLVTTAGNQLVGEAHYLGKPVLAFPEPGNFEQQINAELLNQSGGGLGLAASAISVEVLARFERHRERYCRHIDRARVRGNEAVFSWLDSLLAVSA